MKKKLGIGYLLGIAMCGSIMFGLPVYANSVNVQTHTKSEICSYINTTKEKITTATTYKVSPTLTDLINTSAVGELSDTTNQAALARLNQYRYIAGLDADVTADAVYGQKAQAAAFINALNGGLSHAPAQPAGMSSTLYNLCKAGAGSTNLGAGYGSLPSAVDGWMSDGGVDSLGHRRWILNPTMGKTGFGLVKNSAAAYGTYTAMYAFDGSRSSSYKNVIWPAQLTPLSYFNASATWSVSTGKSETLNAVTVKVVRQKDNKVWTFTASNGLNVNNDGYGQTGCVMFKPDNIGSLADGDIFTVSITGLVDGDLTYQVEFFDETADDSSGGNPGDSTEDSSGGSTGSGSNNNSNNSTNNSANNGTSNSSNNNSSNTGNTTNNNTTENANTSTGSSTVTTSSLKTKVSKFKVTAGKRKLTLSWKKKTGITGYQLQISTKKNFKTKQTYTIGKKTTKKTITKYKGKKLAAKKKYYVRIRAYVKSKNTKGKTVTKYSKWVTVNKKTK